MSAPQVVRASFFVLFCFVCLFVFLTDLAATASRCVFHVRRVSRVIARKVGLSTCGTGMLSSFSITFSFTVESEKSVACVLLQLISMHHSFAQEFTLSMASCMTSVAVEVYSAEVHSARSSACRVLIMSFYIQKEQGWQEDTSLRDSVT